MQFTDTYFEGRIGTTLVIFDSIYEVEFDISTGDVEGLRLQGESVDFDHALLAILSETVDFERIGDRLIDALEAAKADIEAALNEGD
jgi:hypothetical protein